MKTIVTPLPGTPGRAERALGAGIRAAQIAAICAGLTIGALFAYLAIFSQFAFYDDEGYVMLSVKKFLDGLPLYDQIYTQYGPFYYLVKKLVFLIIGAPVTHDITRLTTIVQWIAAACLCAVFVYRETKSVNWGLLAYLQTMLHCRPLANEPGHPQELLVLLLTALITAGSLRPASTSGMLLLGLLAGFTLMTKINAGVYVGVSLSIAFLSLARTSRPVRVAFVSACVAAAILPFLVMRNDLSKGALNYALVVSLSAVSCCIAVWRSAVTSRLELRQLAAAGVAVGVTAALVSAATLLLGTSPAGFSEGILFRPLRFSSVFSIPYPIGSVAVLLGVVSVLLSAALAYAASSARLSSSRLHAVYLVCKVAFGIFGVYVMVVRWVDAIWMAPFLWIVLLPTAADAWPLERLFPRTVLCLVGVLQLLIAYPVAGSQRAWASLLMIPVLIVCLADVGSAIGRQIARPFNRFAEFALLLCAVWWYYPKFGVETQLGNYRAGTPLALPGAQRIRLIPPQVALYQWMTSTVRDQCDALVSMPGYNSLHFWTRIDALTGYNSGAWTIVLTDQEQQRIVDRLATHPNACVIYYRYDFWSSGRSIEREPLVKEIRRSFRAVSAFGDYQLMVRKERAWIADNANRASPARLIKTLADTYAPVPSDLFLGKPVVSLQMSVRTTENGGILGCQSTRAPSPPDAWIPLLYVEDTGRLSGQFYSGRVETITSRAPVNDGVWHRIVLVRDGGRQTLFVDGVEAGSIGSAIDDVHMSHCQIGLAFTKSWPEGSEGWMSFRGQIGQFVVVERALSISEAAEDYRDFREKSGSAMRLIGWSVKQ
jgi:hypothetical protein